MTAPNPFRLSLGAALSALALSAALPALAQTDDRPVVTVAVQDIVTSGALDVMRERSNVGARVFHSIFEGLIDYQRQEADLPQKPMLATEWRQVDDLTVELKLREGVKFHNGDTLDADDVVFTFSPQRFGLLPEQEAARAESAQTATLPSGEIAKVPPAEVGAIYHRSWPLLDRVEKVDELTVRFVTTQPDPTLIGRISRMGSEIYSQQGYGAAETWMAARRDRRATA